MNDFILNNCLMQHYKDKIDICKKLKIIHMLFNIYRILIIYSKLRIII